MSELIKHECGIAYIRLLKPLEYFLDKHRDALFGFNKLSLLMQKQRNRGQDGAGIGCCKLGVPYGKRYMFNRKSVKRDPLSRLFYDERKALAKMERKGLLHRRQPETLRDRFEFGGEILLGHLRYTTSGGVTETYCHPQMRESNWATKSLMVMGNFNLTNLAELNTGMVQRGQHPLHDTDTQVVLEEIGFHLDETHDAIYHKYRDQGVPGEEIPTLISEELDMVRVIRRAADDWDGGYTIAGVVGNGDSFIMRDPNGIRPCFYHKNEDFIVFASERPPLLTVFGIHREDVEELPAGHVASIKNTGEFRIEPFTKQRDPLHCTFERIYFSRGNDEDIYRERKAMGERLVPQVLDAIDHDFEKSVFTFIPNTSETGYFGLLDGLRMHRRKQVCEQLEKALAENRLTPDMIRESIMDGWPRGEKLLHKDEKFRTFISQEEGRKEMVGLAYDMTYGLVGPEDTLVAIDDSIVRGTTLRESIINILSRLNPKKIVIVSTAPQIRYPDCYGIDMSELGKFLAFQAAIRLLRHHDMNHVVEDTYLACRDELKKPLREMKNAVKAIYEPFSADEISESMAELVRPEDTSWGGQVQLVFQKIENLHKAVRDHKGDWYFTGTFPTPGGYSIVNQAYINYVEGYEGRPYDTWL